MNDQTVNEIVRDICDLDPDDPDKPDTVCIDVRALEIILRRHILGEE